ncbi:ABZJ_00895 family protein [Rhizobiaceae bacterium BDR2-2]|uniref:ABZJ_00895 family protein n=1 Tax=Ectorhizobium quercum TaxID=2965071 RepID=A0AAE3N2C9_9HYPH|nr:ABZJ_00895 family protein [Ectorhizobium quercum]MCX8998010.1 ABZJ_00895 family protein [Ectorhizobium quercum]
MTPQPARSISALKLVSIYLATLIGALILVAVLVVALDIFFQIEFRNTAMGFVVIFVAGSATGQFWYSREKERPASGRMWKIAFLCAVLTIALHLLFLWGTYSLAAMNGAGLFPGLRDSDVPLFASILAGLSVLVFLGLRAAIGIGVRQSVKQEEIRARKASKAGKA